jgi:chromosome segregation ATPase
MKMPAALKAVPIESSADRTQERAALHVAIEEHALAKQHVSKLEDARTRASDNPLNLSMAVTQAKAALGEGKAGEDRFLAAVAMCEADAGSSPVKAATAALEKAETDYTQAKKTADALENEAEAAAARLDWVKFKLNDAVKAAVKGDPAMQQLVADHQAAQRAYLEACKLLHALSDIGCNPLGRFGEGYGPQHSESRQGQSPAAVAFLAAIEKLRTDADTPLPTG